jgi:6-pyruvoyltetrahydropterin/6-carboxytetrahydropterin synthase
MYTVTKTFPHSLGLSCVYRNWQATDSHCSYLHGYALSFSVMFEAKTLNDRSWVVDFGAMKGIKEYLVHRYDHTLLVAEDDPEELFLRTLQTHLLAEVRTVKACSVEAFAEDLFLFTQGWLLQQMGKIPGISQVRVSHVYCREHEGNQGAYHLGLYEPQ